jgi:uncharacterized phage-associated protein
MAWKNAPDRVSIVTTRRLSYRSLERLAFPSLIDVPWGLSYHEVESLYRINSGGFAVFLVLSVAKELVRLSFAGDEKDPLTALRLQKLLYYAQAWSLIIRESELFPEDIEAGRWGPVIPVVCQQLPDGLGANQLSPEMFAQVPDLPPEDVEFVQSVWEAYNQYSPLKLSRMTQEETPWLRAWGDRTTDGTEKEYHPIQVQDLEDYFGNQAIPAPLAAYRHELQKREEEARTRLATMPPLDVNQLTTASRTYTPAASRLCT